MWFLEFSMPDQEQYLYCNEWSLFINEPRERSEKKTPVISTSSHIFSFQDTFTQKIVMAFECQHGISQIRTLHNRFGSQITRSKSNFDPSETKEKVHYIWKFYFLMHEFNQEHCTWINLLLQSISQSDLTMNIKRKFWFRLIFDFQHWVKWTS